MIMAEKHSGWSRTSKGARVSSGGAAAKTRTDAGSRVDLDGVPLKYTKQIDHGLPDEFWDEFRRDPAAATAKWTVSEA